MSFLKLSRRFKALLLLGPILCLLTGCVYLVIGGLGAVGGYVVSPDTVEGVTGHDAVSVFDAAIDVLSIMGTIEERNERGGMIISRVSGAKVTVSIYSLTDKTVRLTVKARKTFVPKISISQEVFVKIINQLNG